MPKSNRGNIPPKIIFDSSLFDKKYNESRFESLDSLSKYKEDREIFLSSSFHFGQSVSGLKSTSQLKVDFSEFSNHTFFNSGEVNVNVAFDKFTNYFPFDGTKAETALFFEGLSGFEKWLYDERLPKYAGYLNLSSSNGIDGHYVEFVNNAGVNTNIISSLKTGQPKIAKDIDDAFAIEVSYLAPSTAKLNNGTIFQCVTGSDGIVLALSSSNDGSISSSLYFKVSSLEEDVNDDSFVVSETVMSKLPLSGNKWHHIVAEWDRSSIDNQLLRLYIDGSVDNVSTNFSISDIDLNGATCYVGSGSSFGTDSDDIYGFLSGSINELRIWNRKRTLDEINKFSAKNIFAQEGLALKYSFNEVNGTGKESLVLDGSGNALHGTLKSASLGIVATIPDYSTLRINNTGSSLPTCVLPTSSMTYENSYYFPVLFPLYGGVSDLKSEMVASASDYDRQNEALITKMIPEHYFHEASYFELGDENSSPYGKDIYEENRFDKDSTVGSHVLAGILYTWARLFDELKIFIDQFENIAYYGIDEFDQSPTVFAKLVGDFYGVDLKSFFDDASFRQFFDGESVTLGDDWISNSMEIIRDSLWERIFHALPHVLKSKGTLEAIKSYIRSFGINPDSNFRFVEYGGVGSHVGLDDDKRVGKSEILRMVSMSASNSYFSTPFLTSSNYDSAEHGLLTSQSFTVENIFQIPTNTSVTTQSLCRMMLSTGSSTSGVSPGLLFNVLAISSSSDSSVSSSIKLFGYPIADTGASSNIIDMELTGVNVFDGNKWNVSWGRSVDTYPSHSYFLRVGKNNFGDVINYRATSSWFVTDDSLDITKNLISSDVSGAFLSFGSQSIPSSNGDSFYFLNRDDTPSMSKIVAFDGNISQVRFWSMCLSEDEIIEHIKNPNSLGVKKPQDNFNFSSSYYDSTISGSDPHTTFWKRNRLDISINQPTISSSADGGINFIDFSQNMFPVGPDGEVNWILSPNEVTWSMAFASGSGFEALADVVKNEEFFFSYISPFWDDFSNSDRININPDGVYDSNQLDDVFIDNRFAIEYSIIHALNEDIVNIFSTIKEMNNVVGKPSDVFSMDYKSLENLRMTYFNRLKDKINLKGFFDFFSWFDSNIIEFIKQITPARSNFIGNNFVIESHMLERPKYSYKFYTQFIDKNNVSVSEEKSDYTKTINDDIIEFDL
jgi:hypothetical protein